MQPDKNITFCRIDKKGSFLTIYSKIKAISSCKFKLQKGFDPIVASFYFLTEWQAVNASQNGNLVFRMVVPLYDHPRTLEPTHSAVRLVFFCFMPPWFLFELSQKKWEQKKNIHTYYAILLLLKNYFWNAYKNWKHIAYQVSRLVIGLSSDYFNWFNLIARW